MICAGIAVRGPTCIDDAVQEQDSGARFVISGNEGDRCASVSGSGNRCLNQHRASGPLGACSQLERMQAMRIVGYAAGYFHRHSDYVQGSGVGVDDGSACNSYLWNDLVTVE